MQVGQRVLRAGQQDDVRFLNLVDVAGIIGIEARVHIQDVEVGKVRHTFQQDDGDIDFAVLPGVCLHIQGDGVFFFYLDVTEPGDNAYDGEAGQLFQYRPSFFKQRRVSAEFIDDDTFHLCPFFWFEQCDSTVNRAEYTAPVDIGNQVGGGVCLYRHPHVGDIAVAQV